MVCPKLFKADDRALRRLQVEDEYGMVNVVVWRDLASNTGLR
ncbi:hypothetical protein PSEUDO8BK_60027 [Pseudomonas sp. 8BK]|nr:hypothetical protein PSEUDO8BK_60027 [Pseudomonas sp. 8BK]